MEAFLAGSEPVQFEARDQASLYEWVTGTLREQGATVGWGEWERGW